MAGHDIVVIGASMGGLEAVSELFSDLPADIPASFFVALHMHPSSPSVLDRIVANQTSLAVKFAEDGEVPRKGTVYLAPKDFHLILNQDSMLLSRGPRENRFRPAIDPLFRSAAVEHTTRVIGLLLTGRLDDGTAGMQAIAQCGGITVVQDPKDAECPEMPQSALDRVKIDHVMPMQNMGQLIQQLVKQAPSSAASVPEMLRREVQLAKGIIDPKIEANILAPLVPYSCPDCGGGMSEITQGNVMNYRCHEGHSYSPLSLAEAQEEKIEYSLWVAIRLMEEQASLLDKLAGKKDRSTSSFAARAHEFSSHAQKLKDFLFHQMQNRL